MNRSETWWEGWYARAVGWPLYRGHSEQYRAGWLARNNAELEI